MNLYLSREITALTEASNITPVGRPLIEATEIQDLGGS
jgi:hypothetical protein